MYAFVKHVFVESIKRLLIFITNINVMQARSSNACRCDNYEHAIVLEDLISANSTSWSTTMITIEYFK